MSSVICTRSTPERAVLWPCEMAEAQPDRKMMKPQMNADERRWKKDTCTFCLSAFICVHPRFQRMLARDAHFVRVRERDATIAQVGDLELHVVVARPAVGQLGDRR